MVQTSLFDLTGKVALLTGASKGMGKAMAQALAEHGARVMISSRKLDQCQAVADEINADVILKGTRVDGIYTADPEKDPTAKKYESISFQDCISQQLKVMDMTAFTLCMENKLPIIVFDMNQPDNLRRVISGEKVGTLVK